MRAADEKLIINKLGPNVRRNSALSLVKIKSPNFPAMDHGVYAFNRQIKNPLKFLVHVCMAIPYHTGKQTDGRTDKKSTKI